MKTVTKKIVRANTYSIPGPKGTHRKEVVTSDRIKHWAKQGNAMVKAGLKIPAPVNHDFNALPVQIGPNGLTDAQKNTGFWKRLVAKKDEEGIMALYGELDVPDSLEDSIGKTIQETSIYVRPKFTDGLGREWIDAPMHVALVNNPIEPNQENFAEGSLALSMAMEATNGEEEGSAVVTTKAGGVKDAQENPAEQGDENNLSCNIAELIAQLREVAKVDLPDDTLPENLAERLLGALRQKRLSELEDEEEEGNTRQPPAKSKEPPKPFVMSQLTPAEQAAADKATLDLVMAHPAYKSLQETATNALAAVTASARRSLSGRVSKLIRAGVITKEYAEKHLLPPISSHTPSFNDKGESNPSAAEALLEALEGVAPRAAEQAPGSVAGVSGPANPALAMSHSNPFLMNVDPNQIRRSLAMSMGVGLGDFDIQEPPAWATNGPTLDEATMDANAKALAAMA